MLILVLSLVIDFVLQVILISLATVTILNGKSPPLLWKTILPLFGIFALLDMYWIPGISVLDATINISNKEIIELLGYSSIAASDLFIPDGFSVAVWAFKSLLSGIITQRLLLRRSV
jgi:hypothetical protein